MQEIYVLKITLEDSKPKIWRAVEVPCDFTFYKLHQTIQLVMPWEESHLHHFILEMRTGREITIETSEKKIALRQYLPDAKKVVYEYDFGDCWRHEIKLEKVVQAEDGAPYPRCVEGKMACPPEDCGGIYGYYEMLDIINGPDCEAKEEMLEWLGENFDPNEFDIHEIKFPKRLLCSYAQKVKKPSEQK